MIIKGVLSSLDEQKITIQYLPGTPEPFSKSFLVCFHLYHMLTMMVYTHTGASGPF